MKKNITLLFLLISFVSFSQFGNRNQQRQLPQPTAQAPEPDFPIERYLGIIIYDIEKASKKSGIKASSKVGKEFFKTLTIYNKSIKDITRINSFLIKDTKDMVDNFQKNAIKTGDYSEQTKIQKKMGENLKPLFETLKKEDLELDKNMKTLLSEKQYKKWIKYNKKNYKVFPKE